MGGPSVTVDEPIKGTCKIDYVISSERHNAKHPYLKNFTQVLEQDSEFRKVFENIEHPPYQIAIFEYLGPDGSRNLSIN